MANLITLIRVILCVLVVLWLNLDSSDPTLLWCFGLTIVVIWFDGLDGFVARKLNESSSLGAMIDILGDRIVEQIYWLSFAVLGWIPLWIPILVIIRGVTVDGFRAVAFEKGFTAFGDTSMMQSDIGVLLVSSRFSRFTYALCKAIAFAGIILHQYQGLIEPWTSIVSVVTWTTVYLAVFFCVVRGLPVIIESKRFFKEA